MNSIGNILWLILGGILIAIIYYIVGLLMCITIIGIPFGVQLLKLGTYALWPFGHELVDGPNQPGCVSIVMNLIWILLGWWEIAVIHLVCGLLFALPSWGFLSACSTSRWPCPRYSRLVKGFDRIWPISSCVRRNSEPGSSKYAYDFGMALWATLPKG